MFRYLICSVLGSIFTTIAPVAHADSYSDHHETLFGAWYSEPATMYESLVESDFGGNSKPDASFFFTIGTTAGLFYVALEAQRDVLDDVKANTYTLTFTNAQAFVAKMDLSGDEYFKDGSVMRIFDLTQVQIRTVLFDIAISDTFTVTSQVNNQSESTTFDTTGFKQAFQASFPHSTP